MTKKINKRIMIIILILLLISISLGIGAYAAYVLNATEVQYTRNGSTVSVKAALDDLYASNRFQSSQISLFFGDTIEVGGETFFVVQYSSKSENHVSAISALPLLYDSSSGKYRQKTVDELPGRWSFGSVAYWSSISSGNHAYFDINGIKGYGSNTVMGVIESYAESLGALDFGLPGHGDIEPVLGITYYSSDMGIGRFASTYSHMLATDSMNYTCWGNVCYCYSIGSSDAGDYECSTWDWDTSSFSGVGEVEGVLHECDYELMDTKFAVRPVLVFRKSDVTVIDRVIYSGSQLLW